MPTTRRVPVHRPFQRHMVTTDRISFVTVQRNWQSVTSSYCSQLSTPIVEIYQMLKIYLVFLRWKVKFLNSRWSQVLDFDSHHSWRRWSRCGGLWSQLETSLTRWLPRSSHKRSGANLRQFGRPPFRNCPQIRDASLHWRASKRDIGKYRLWVSASLTAMNKTLERSEIIRQRY